MPRVFITFFMILLFACQQKKQAVSREVFVKVLSELYIAEALSTKQDSNMAGQKDYYKSFQEDIFRQHHITYEQYQSTYDYYKKDLKEMQKIHEEAVGKISEQQATGTK